MRQVKDAGPEPERFPYWQGGTNPRLYSLVQQNDQQGQAIKGGGRQDAGRSGSRGSSASSSDFSVQCRSSLEDPALILSKEGIRAGSG
jgi:hypothetical protein